jgi:xanthine permease XanP
MLLCLINLANTGHTIFPILMSAKAKPPVQPPVERPDDLIYGLADNPPLLHQAMLGFQHVAVICPYLVLVALVVDAAGLPHTVAQSALALALIAVGLMTVLQGIRLGPIGSGYLCPPVVSAIYLPAALMAAKSHGLPAVCGMIIFAGLCELILSRFVQKLRKYFPPVVSGVVIIAVGIELGKIAVSVIVDHAGAHPNQHLPIFITAFVALGVMAGLGIWAKGLPKLLCALIGVVAGYGLAALFGLFPGTFVSDFQASPWLSLPDPSFLGYRFEPSLIVPFLIAGLASGLRVVGVLTTCQQMNDARWRRPDMKNIQRGVAADGLGCALGGVLGTPGMSASPSLVGIEKTTGVTSRILIWSILGWLLLLACLPKFAGLIINMPRPVMAAALFFNGALMFVAGIHIAVSRPINLRATLTIGFSILAALSVPLFPEFYALLPAWTHPFTGSVISMAVIVAVPLNALFLIGSWHRSKVQMGEDKQPLTAEAFAAFFREKAIAWKLPTADVQRVLQVVQDMMQDLASAAEGPVEVSLASDGYDLKVTFLYRGVLPAMNDNRPGKAMVEEQSFISGLTGYLAGTHADRVNRSAKDDRCEMTLLFQI